MAQFNTFYIPMTDDGQAAERLNAFLRSHRVMAVRQRDFPEGWGFCVEWIDGDAARPAGAPYQNPYQREKVDYMKVLSPDDFKRFSEYRRRRKEIAEADGVKPFVVMTDAQMAELAKMEAPTKADLAKIDGFGEARIEKFGERILDGNRLQSAANEGLDCNREHSTALDRTAIDNNRVPSIAIEEETP